MILRSDLDPRRLTNKHTLFHSHFSTANTAFRKFFSHVEKFSERKAEKCFSSILKRRIERLKWPLLLSLGHLVTGIEDRSYHRSRERPVELSRGRRPTAKFVRSLRDCAQRTLLILGDGPPARRQQKKRPSFQTAPNNQTSIPYDYGSAMIFKSLTLSLTATITGSGKLYRFDVAPIV